ncbi:MAG TPA: hypothetical protein VGM07_18510 [Stellaceae bacterium]
MDRRLGILIGQPAEPPCGADRAVWGGNLDALALGEELPASLPYRFEAVDQPQDRAVTLDERLICLTADFVHGGQRRRGLGQPPL